MLKIFGGVCPHTIRNWVKKGILSPPVKINGINYYVKEEVDALRARLLEERDERESV